MTAYDVQTRNGFKYGGLDSKDYGVFVVSYDIPPMPNTRDYELELDGHTGIYDAGTELSRVDIVLHLAVYVKTGGVPAVRQALRNLMAAMDPQKGYQPLTFNEDPGVYINAKLTSTSGSAATTQLPDSPTGEVVFGVDLQMKAADPHWYSWSNDTISQTGTGGFQVNNPGAAVWPTITMAWTAAAPTGGFVQVIQDNYVRAFQVTQAMKQGDVVTADMETWQVQINGVDTVTAWTGEMFQLPNGTSQINVLGPVNVTVAFKPRWPG